MMLEGGSGYRDRLLLRVRPLLFRLRPPVLRLRLPPLRLRGTFPPARRASLRPIAMACLRLVTFLPDRPERRVPCLRSCIARLTLLWAFLPYFAIRPPAPRAARHMPH